MARKVLSYEQEARMARKVLSYEQEAREVPVWTQEVLSSRILTV
jgi:hypothetical protein